MGADRAGHSPSASAVRLPGHRPTSLLDERVQPITHFRLYLDLGVMNEETQALVRCLSCETGRAARVVTTALLLSMVILFSGIAADPAQTEGEFRPFRLAVGLLGFLLIAGPMVVFPSRQLRLTKRLKRELCLVPTRNLIRESREWPRGLRSMVTNVLWMRAYLDRETAAREFLLNRPWDLAEQRTPRPLEELESSLRSRHPEINDRERLVKWLLITMMLPTVVMLVGGTFLYFHYQRVIAGEIPYGSPSRWLTYVALASWVPCGVFVMIGVLLNPDSYRNPPPIGKFSEGVQRWLAGDVRAASQVRAFCKLKGKKSAEVEHIRSLGMELWEEELNGLDMWPLFRLSDYRHPPY